jgi:FkbM family methyltransferase
MSQHYPRYPKYHKAKSLLRALAPKRLPLFLKDSPVARQWNRLRVWLFPDLSGYASQSGQDLFLHQYLGLTKKDGFFVDIGAFDGVEISNSLFFERELGWKGLCVEPIPEIFARLRANRSADCINAAAGTRDGQAEFVVLEGGFETGSHLAKQGEVAKAGARRIPVEVVDIARVLREHGVKQIDFLSIDIEGGEMELLDHIAATGMPIDVVAMELNMNFVEMDAHMARHGYRLEAQVGADRIYRRR